MKRAANGRPLRFKVRNWLDRQLEPELVNLVDWEASLPPCGETARDLGVSVEGVCLYPVLDYPGWENERVCPVGLLSMPNERGQRTVCSTLARELRRQQQILTPRTRVADGKGAEMVTLTR